MEAPQLRKQQIQTRLKEIDSAVAKEQRASEAEAVGDRIEDKVNQLFLKFQLNKLTSERQEQQTILAVFERQIQEVSKHLSPLQEQYRTFSQKREAIRQALLENIRQLNYDLYPLAEEENNRIVLPEGTVIRHRKKRPKAKRPRVPPRVNHETVPGTPHLPVTAPTVAYSNGGGSGGNGNGAVRKRGNFAEGKNGYHSCFHYELGWDKESGEPVVYRPSPLESDFLPNGHVLMAGKSGSGKTWLQYQLSTIKEDLRGAKKGVSCLNTNTSLNAAFTNHPLIRGRPSSLDGDVPDNSFTAHAHTGTNDAVIIRTRLESPSNCSYRSGK